MIDFVKGLGVALLVVIGCFLWVLLAAIACQGGACGG